MVYILCINDAVLGKNDCLVENNGDSCYDILTSTLSVNGGNDHGCQA